MFVSLSLCGQINLLLNSRILRKPDEIMNDADDDNMFLWFKDAMPESRLSPTPPVQLNIAS